jgi:hypothetical protein
MSERGTEERNGGRIEALLLTYVLDYAGFRCSPLALLVRGQPTNQKAN